MVNITNDDELMVATILCEIVKLINAISDKVNDSDLQDVLQNMNGGFEIKKRLLSVGAYMHF